MGQLFWLRREQGRMPDLLTDGVGRLAERRQYFPVWSAAMVLLCSEIGQPAAAADQLAAVLAQTDGLRALPPHGWSVAMLALLAEAIDSLLRTGGSPAEHADLARQVDALLEPHTDELALAGWPTVLSVRWPGPADCSRWPWATSTPPTRTSPPLSPGWAPLPPSWRGCGCTRLGCCWPGRRPATAAGPMSCWTSP
jgi:hypothetical protein